MKISSHTHLTILAWTCTVFMAVILVGCVSQECPPPETVIVHDTVSTLPEPASENDIVGYFDPVEMVVFAKKDHAEKVMEILQAKRVSGDRYKMMAFTPEGEQMAVSVVLKLVPNPAEQGGMRNGPSQVVAGTIYANAECAPYYSKAYYSDCELALDSIRYFRLHRMRTGSCRKGKGYCCTLDGLKAAIWEYYQDRECEVLLDAIPRPADSRCLPPADK